MVEVMKGSLVAAVLSLVVLFSGCTMVETAEQRDRRIRQSDDLQMRMAVHDIDAILLLDRNTSLTEWFTRVGY